MDKRKDFTGVNPDIRLDQILIDPEANRPAMFAMLNSFAVGTVPSFIIDGCDPTIVSGSPDGWSITAGYIFLDGEILQVEAQSGTFINGSDYLIYNKETTYDTRGDITYLDGTPRQTWQKNRGVISVESSRGSTDLDAFVFADRLDDKIKDYIALETEILSVTGGLQTKIIEIGDWDMDTTASLNKNHGVTLGNIRSINVVIRDDAGSASIPLDYDLAGTGASGNFAASSTQIQMLRTTGGLFDNTGYNSTSYNRGWITIQYIP